MVGFNSLGGALLRKRRPVGGNYTLEIFLNWPDFKEGNLF